MPTAQNSPMTCTAHAAAASPAAWAQAIHTDEILDVDHRAAANAVIGGPSGPGALHGDMGSFSDGGLDCARRRRNQGLSVNELPPFFLPTALKSAASTLDLTLCLTLA
jgi:hypothetical protein